MSRRARCLGCKMKFEAKHEIESHLQTGCKSEWTTEELQTSMQLAILYPDFLDKNYIEDQDYIVCKLCGYVAKALKEHLPSVHGIHAKEYLTKFPGSRVTRAKMGKLRKSTYWNNRSCRASNPERDIYDMKSWDASDWVEYRQFRRCLNVLQGSSRRKSTKVHWFACQEDIDYVVCKECNLIFPRLDNHIIHRHQMTTEEYLVRYPGSKLVRQRSMDVMKQTFFTKYGVESSLNLSQTQEALNEYRSDPDRVRAQQQKGLQTVNKKYGTNVSNVSQIPEIIAKIKRTVRDRYGVDNVSQLPEVRKKTDETWRVNWGVSHPLKHAKIRSKVMGFRPDVGPNKPEKHFESITKPEVRYTGNYDYRVEIPGKVQAKYPDFVVEPIEKTKTVIEIFGDYWHGEGFRSKYANDYRTDEEHVQQCIDEYASAGYKCIVLWESEVYDWTTLVNRIPDYLIPLSEERNKHEQSSN